MLPSLGIRAVLIAIALAVAVGGFHAWVKSIEARGEARCRASYAEAALHSERENARTAVRNADRNMEIANALEQQTRRDAALAADRRAGLERMRQLADATADRAAAAASSASGSADEASDLRRLLAEGGRRVVELEGVVAAGRERLAEMAAQVIGLQTYVASVCRPAP